MVFNTSCLSVECRGPPKRNRSYVVVLGEDPKADCRLITTCVLNTTLYLFLCVSNRGHHAAKFSGAHFAVNCLVSTQGNSQCVVAQIMGVTQVCVGKILLRNRQQPWATWSGEAWRLTEEVYVPWRPSLTSYGQDEPFHFDSSFQDADDLAFWQAHECLNCHKATSGCWKSILASYQWPLLLTWFNFNPSMDK